MYDAGHRHYYINEVAQLKSGQFVIPVRWLEDVSGEIFADAYPVTFDAQVRLYFLKLCPMVSQRSLKDLANVDDHNSIAIKASDLQFNYLDLQDMNLLPTWTG